MTIDVRYTGSKPGILKTLLIKEEDTVVVGQAVAEVEETDAEVPIEQPTADADIKPQTVEPSKPQPKTETKSQPPVPEVGTWLHLNYSTQKPAFACKGSYRTLRFHFE